MGKVVIPCIWNSASDFSEGLARVENKNSRWGYIDITGEVVIPCEWSDALDFSEGLAGVRDLHIPFTSAPKWGFIDMRGVLAIPYTWDFVDSFKNGMATVKDHKGNFLIIDKEGNVLSNKRIEL